MRVCWVAASRKHATISRIETEDGVVWELEDNGSVNGTFVNLRKIERVRLKYGNNAVVCVLWFVLDAASLVVQGW